MEKTTLRNAKIGALIVRDVYGIDGKLLAKRGSTYQECYGTRFEAHGVSEVFLDAEQQSPEDPLLHVQKSLKLQDVIHDRTRNHANLQMKKTIHRMKTVSNKNLFKIGKLVETMIEEILEKKDFVLALTQMRSIDDYTYQHSVNVGVLSIMIGVDLGFDKETLKRLGMGAILHDVGKAMVPEHILKKPGRLTAAEYLEVQKHPIYGYEMLRHTDISEEAALVALCHHEKYDGTGYNRGLSSKSIPKFSRIVTVADVYDAMSNDRIYQEHSSHDKVYREITHLGGSHFDTEIMEQFAKHLSIYPTGSGIILNSGRRGLVLSQNRLYPESPVVRIFTPEKGNLREMYQDIDLSVEKRFYIIDTF